MRNLVLVLGDQLDRHSSAFDGFDKAEDVVWMAEVAAESEHVWSHKARIALFLSAMRHFRRDLANSGFKVHYRDLDDPTNSHSFSGELSSSLSRLQPQKVIVTQPGEWRVVQSLKGCCQEHDVELETRIDRHFFCGIDEFKRHASGRKQLRLEYFYREMRRKHDVLMVGDQPLGGKWNYDAKNRESFGKKGPGEVSIPKRFAHSAITKEVLAMVDGHFAGHPGTLDEFDWPVTRRQAKSALRDFIQCRLPQFGLYQDAMWTAEPFLYHSRLSAALNLKLLNPRDVIDEAVLAHHAGQAPLESVEGFVRQILGWREYVRGIYWMLMPEYLDRNELDVHEPLPKFFWTGDTEMNCLRETIHQTLRYGYAHHIQRLMVTGLFSLLLGVEPRQIHEWYLAVYTDAVEWVELPNTLGMSQYADGGVMASKPYAATGKYIQRMSNYCGSCRFRPTDATGERACPFTTLYWDFLQRNEAKLSKNQRMSLQVRNLSRKSKQELGEIQEAASSFRQRLRGDR